MVTEWMSTDVLPESDDLTDRNAAISLPDFGKLWSIAMDDAQAVSERFPFRLNRHFASLFRFRGDPLWRQAVPDARELSDASGLEDPLAEESLSPVPNLVHRYPNRVLWLVAQECAMYCRFCTRKRRWGKSSAMTEESFQAGLDYIRCHPEVKDVLLSGGDPLLLPVSRLEAILTALRKIRHVQIIRIGSRIPCVLPQRITPQLVSTIAKYHPVFMNLHFNHPWEITAESRRACTMLADAGIPLGSQTVLLRGVNDSPEVLGELFQNLLTLRVRPYYLLQMDLIQGTTHFRTPLSRGLDILQALRNHISGLAMPHFVIDLPGGRGKVPLTPSSIAGLDDDRLMLRNYQGSLCEYPLLDGEGPELQRRLSADSFH